MKLQEMRITIYGDYLFVLIMFLSLMNDRIIVYGIHEESRNIAFENV